ncbi:hypothetical protein VBG99_06910 [Clostridium perfringens]|uniref:hypothetical protein n=1 Tax=Clostridium perfringens TaxID=1502 RepID=UPI00240EECDA|nr:hypothetical protein [Clostridium perfringens]WFD92084.1 hypothetical protein P7C80_15130 [Clostridium perfringens]
MFNMMTILIVISFLVIIIATLVTTYILVDMFKEKSYLDDKFLFIYFLVATTFEWGVIILIVWRMII